MDFAHRGNFSTEEIHGNGTIIDTPLTKNIAKADIYLQSLNVREIREEPGYTDETLASTLGGTLGVYLGIALVLGFELIELCFDLCVAGCKHYKGKRAATGGEGKSKEEESEAWA